LSTQVRSLRVDAATGYSPAVGRLVWALDDTRGRTLKAIEGLTQAELDWSDSAAPNSIGTLLYHTAAIEADWVFCDILGLAIPDDLTTLFAVDVRERNGRLSPVGGDLGSHLARLATVRRAVRNALRQLADDDLDRTRAMEGYEVSPAWAIHHLMQHEAEHRGQIGELRQRATSR
jgi:uncharacterized damage-inducible protein DinB